MKKSDVPSAAELFCGSATSGKCESTLLSVRLSQSRRGDPVQCTTSAAHTSVESWCEEYWWSSLDEEKERLARKKGHDLENVGLLRKCTYGTADAGARWQGHCARILEEHGLVRSLSNPFLFVQVERDIRLLAHGGDFMVEMPTHEENWFESVLFSEWDGKCTGEFHSDGNTAMEASFLDRVVRWDPTPARAELEAGCDGASRPWNGEINTSCNSCCQASEVRRTSIAGRCETSERRRYHVVQVSRDARELPVSGPSRLVSRCRLSGTSDEESHDERPRGTQACWAPLVRATS